MPVTKVAGIFYERLLIQRTCRLTWLTLLTKSTITKFDQFINEYTMKTTFIILSMLLGGISIYAQAENPNYKKELADSLGADDYGMKMYVLVILKTGENKAVDKKVQDSIFMGHLQNIKRLANDGKLIVAGPMAKNDRNYEGIFILNVKTTAEAQKLLGTDPAISAKLLTPELYGWYGSAALPLFLKYHDSVKKKDF